MYLWVCLSWWVCLDLGVGKIWLPFSPYPPVNTSRDELSAGEIKTLGQRPGPFKGPRAISGAWHRWERGRRRGKEIEKEWMCRIGEEWVREWMGQIMSVVFSGACGCIAVVDCRVRRVLPSSSLCVCVSFFNQGLSLLFVSLCLKMAARA